MRTVAGNGRFGSADGEGLEAGFATPNGIAWDPTRETLYVNDYVVPFPQRRSVPARSLLRRIQLPSLPALFRQTLEAEGLDAAVAAYREYKDGNPRFTELEVNALGYGYLQQGRVDVALKVFELNAEFCTACAYPFIRLTKSPRSKPSKLNSQYRRPPTPNSLRLSSCSIAVTH